MAKFHIYGLGAALVDTELEVSDSDLESLGVEKGLMTLVDEARQQQLIDHLSDHLVTSKRASGGSAANTIIAASYFGANTCYACKVADDDNGQFYLQDLSDAGVTHHRNGSLPAGTTGKCLVLITPDAERSMNTFLGISETIGSDNLDADAIANSDYLYMEGYLVTSESGRPAAVAARQIAEQAGVKTAISLSDPAMVQFFKEGLQEMIGERVNLLFANRDEALGWTGSDDIDSACEQLKKSADCFAVTLGADGALVYDGNELHKVDGVAADAIDTNGAGDMFAGAFLYGLSQGWDYPKSGSFACRAAAQVVSQYGPRLRAEQHRELLT
ncbi:adenosine kinase [Porticoccus sp. W117]|uniref:adenosine kinase n=1 Tax=Porticoccus sp. W117 TaxID=3054777 RepID=UPI002596F02D|nr:adenosine kinase [Porticoccus sp. W117]MDM3870491.1 adenosine kinase [Porticoccus sp. W117]